MPVVPRDSASSSHSEDGEVPSTASSDRHSSSVTCQILIKRTAAESHGSHWKGVSAERQAAPSRAALLSRHLKIINQQDWKTSLCCSLLAAPPLPGRGGRALQAGCFTPHGQPPSSSFLAELWQCPAGHRLQSPFSPSSSSLPSQGLDWKPQGGRPGASLLVKQWLKLLSCREKWEPSCHHEEQRDPFSSP